MATGIRFSRDPVSRRRTPALVRTGEAAVLAMVLLAALLGTVGGLVLLWVGTRMLDYLR